MRKFGNTAGDDLENLISVAGEGAVRLQGEFFLLLRWIGILEWVIADLCFRGYKELFERVRPGSRGLEIGLGSLETRDVI